MAPALQLLPAVDVADGQPSALRGAAGTETSYGSPRDAALGLAARRCAVGAHGRPRRGVRARGQLALLADVIAELDVDVELSGGIRDDDSLAAALATGCTRVNLGTAAIENPQWCASAIAEYGDKIAVGLDVTADGDSWRLRPRLGHRGR